MIKIETQNKSYFLLKYKIKKKNQFNKKILKNLDHQAIILIHESIG